MPFFMARRSTATSRIGKTNPRLHKQPGILTVFQAKQSFVLQLGLHYAMFAGALVFGTFLSALGIKLRIAQGQKNG